MKKSFMKLIAKVAPENNRLERIWKLAQVDFKKRYYNDRLGLFWAFLNPALKVMVYYLLFTIIFKRAIEGIPNYALFIFSGIIFWQNFTETSKACMRVILQKKYLIENIRVKKIDLFLSITLASLMGFLFNVVAYIVISLFTGAEYGPNALLIPLLILNTSMIGMGFGMILSVVFIFVRDINHLLDIVFLFGFWSSGIFFRGEIFIEIFPPFLYLHPFVGIIMNVRNTMLYNHPVNVELLYSDLIYGLLLVVIGYFILKKFSHKALEKI